MNKLITLLICISTLLMAPAVFAQDSIAWHQLTTEQQALLKSVEGDWQTMHASRQKRLLKGTDRWLNMDETKREKASERFEKFRQLPAAQQDLLRAKYQTFMQMKPDEQKRILSTKAWFQSQPDERRRELRQQWNNMSREQRHDFIQQQRQNRTNRMTLPNRPSMRKPVRR